MKSFFILHRIFYTRKTKNKAQLKIAFKSFSINLLFKKTLNIEH
jgi:hypothetical protein